MSERVKCPKCEGFLAMGFRFGEVGSHVGCVICGWHKDGVRKIDRSTIPTRAEYYAMMEKFKAKEAA